MRCFRATYLSARVASLGARLSGMVNLMRSIIKKHFIESLTRGKYCTMALLLPKGRHGAQCLRYRRKRNYNLSSYRRAAKSAEIPVSR